jgi:hypothetical protein
VYGLCKRSARPDRPTRIGQANEPALVQALVPKLPWTSPRGSKTFPGRGLSVGGTHAGRTELGRARGQMPHDLATWLNSAAGSRPAAEFEKLSRSGLVEERSLCPHLSTDPSGRVSRLRGSARRTLCSEFPGRMSHLITRIGQNRCIEVGPAIAQEISRSRRSAKHEGARLFSYLASSHRAPALGDTPAGILGDTMFLGSISQRNTLAKFLGRTTEPQRLPGALVEPKRDLVEFCL